MMNDTQQTGDALPFSHLVRPTDLPTGRPTTFELVPTPAQCDAIAQDLGIIGLRKLRFSGSLKPFDKHDWQMSAKLGATVTQECVVTLEPVTTRLEDAVERKWLRLVTSQDTEEEIEIPEDENVDPLSDVIDLGLVMIEALAIALPLYPRSEGAEVATQVFAEPGTKPMTDEDARPFAGLSALRDKLADKGD